MSPSEGVEVPDQVQLDHEPKHSALAYDDITAGQTFVPLRSPLYRMDFRLNNADDSRPGELKLYRWNGSRQETVGQKPLFEDVVDLSGADGFRTYSFFPRSEIEPGATYYVELTGRGRPAYRIAQAVNEVDPYPPGEALKSGPPAPSGPYRDLWFRTFTIPSADAQGIASVPLISLNESNSSPPPRLASDSKAPWFPPQKRSGSITRRHYLERVQNFADRFRISGLEQCRENLYGNALREAFLYRVSCEEGQCDERRVKDALAYFQNGYDWQFCTPRSEQTLSRCTQTCTSGGIVAANSIERPATAYRWLRLSPSLTPEDHAQIRELLLDRARRLWPRREGGSHNRAMTAAVGYWLVSDLFPDEPEAVAWRAFAEATWKEFWDHRETHEDSAHYSGSVWWPAVLEYVEAAGLEGLVWSDPGFLKLVERFSIETFPLGVLPNWGDSAGWSSDPSGLIWLFESAARHTRRPDFRWLAHRLFAYSTRRVRDGWPRSDAFYKGHAALVRAYFAADETLEPRPPSDRQERRIGHGAPMDPVERRVDGAQVLGARFEAGSTPLVRLELRARNLGDERPARVSLWKWLGDRDSSLVRTPIFRGALSMVGPDRMVRRAMFPFLELEVGEDYYLEIERRDAPMILETDGTDANSLSLSAFTLVGQTSVVTDRLRANHLRKDDHRVPPQQYEFTDERVPDKLVLRSGNDPLDMQAEFNLVANHQHGQSEMGALVALVDGGSVLMTSGPFPYWFFGNVRTPQDESLPFVRRHWGGDMAEPGGRATVAHFSDSRAVTVASIRFLDPSGWQIQQERRIFFVKNRFLLIRDRFTVPADMAISAGPIWHARDLSGERGADFFDLYNRQPLSDIWRMRNPKRHALVYFVPRSGNDSDAMEPPAHLPPASCPRDSTPTVSAECRGGPTFVAYQRWVGEARAGESRWFDTLIVPHNPKISARGLAETIRVLSATGGIALEIEMGAERWLVVDNPSRRDIELRDLRTDAHYVVARISPEATPYVLTNEASRIRWRDLSLEWPVVTSVELGGTLPARRLTGW